MTVSTDSLGRLTTQLVGDTGVASALVSKLDAARASGAKGNAKARENQLQAFKNQVEAQRGKKVTSAQADVLSALADALIASP